MNCYVVHNIKAHAVQKYILLYDESVYFYMA